MNNEKVCFIMCVNDEIYEKECVYYLEQLKLPPGFKREILRIKGAESMASGYNQAMYQSDAKYKVYLHQDVFIVNRSFIESIVRLFQSPEIGMIGLVGNLDIEKLAVMWYGERVGMLHSNSVFFSDSYLFGEIQQEYQQVQAIDGLLMATQYDIPWREDLFKGWDFYDISQSMEFRRLGYQVVVPRTEKPWCVHDDGILNLDNYFSERDTFIENYFEVKID